MLFPTPQERLVDVLDHLLPVDPSEAAPAPAVRAASLWVPMEEVAPEKLVTGALEAAFHDMVRTAEVAWDSGAFIMQIWAFRKFSEL